MFEITYNNLRTYYTLRRSILMQVKAIKVL